jgi:hypothetical protein
MCATFVNYGMIVRENRCDRTVMRRTTQNNSGENCSDKTAMLGQP